MNPENISKAFVLLDIDDVLFDTAHFKNSQLTEYRLFDEVRQVLEALGNIAEIGILSQGDHEFQIKKLLETHIHDHFSKDHIHIVERKDESLVHVLQRYKHIKTLFFVDDRISSLYYAKQALPAMITIWLKRGRYANTQDPIPGFTPDKTTEDFRDIISFVKDGKLES